MRTAIVIPARYGSTRLPGKPLKLIAGKTMLQRVYEIAQFASKETGSDIYIATDHEDIANYAKQLGAKYILTPESCPTGTDRVYAAVEQLSDKPEFILALQGDAPLTPPWFLTAILEEFKKDSSLEMITPVTQLTWEQLDRMRVNKQTTPFSGTTAVLLPTGDALWFSKQILPAIRKENRSTALSPVFRHIGLYGYRYDTLEAFVKLPIGYYEEIEGLEQLRLLENGYSIRCVKVDYQGRPSMSGVDSPEDVVCAEQLIAQYGEMNL